MDNGFLIFCCVVVVVLFCYVLNLERQVRNLKTKMYMEYYTKETLDKWMGNLSDTNDIIVDTIGYQWVYDEDEDCYRLEKKEVQLNDQESH